MRSIPLSLLAGQVGQQYIDTLRGIAMLAASQGGFMRCYSCSEKAVWVGMQACGAPGGPICDAHLQQHREWMDTAEAIAEAGPYCRHCDKDVGRDHIYAVSLYDSTANPVAL